MNARKVFEAAALLMVSGCGLAADLRYVIDGLPFSAIEPDSAVWVDVGGINARYVDTGAGEPVIFLHGLSGSVENWEEVVNQLAPGHRYLRVDLPGFGETARPDNWICSTENYVAFVTGFLDALGVERATVVGYSMGGKIAWSFALTHRERVGGLVLIDALSYSQRRDLVAGLLRRRAEASDSVECAISGGVLVDGGDELIPQLSGLPTLILWGLGDLLLPLEEGWALHRDISPSYFHAFFGSGHLILAQRPEGISARLDEFLNR